MKSADVTELEALAHEVDCKTCGAAAGKPCVITTSRKVPPPRASSPHQSRVHRGVAKEIRT